MDNSNPIDVSPFRSLMPIIAHNDDETETPSSPPPHSDDVNEEIHNTTIHHPPLMVTPLQTIRPSDKSNKDSCAPNDFGPSTVPIKRRRGRPKGSKNSTTKKRSITDDVKEEIHNATTPQPLMATPVDTNGDDDGPSIAPIKRGHGRPTGSKNSTAKKKPKTDDVTPVLTIVPFDDSNNKNYVHGDEADSSTASIKRGCGRPKGSKNSRTTEKPGTNDPPIRKVVISCPNFDSGISEAERENGNRELTGTVLMRFDAVRRRLCQLGYTLNTSLLDASTNCKNLGVRTNMKKRTGSVPGIEVGDIFYLWAEFNLVGIHMQPVAGIDYLTDSEDGLLATSVVTSRNEDNETEDVETLVYAGQGGKDKHGQLFDQKLEKGNLALETSRVKGNEVRVIRGEKDPKDKTKKVYIYDGLYSVSDCWRVIGKSGFIEFRFRLVRKPDQPSGYAIWKSAEKIRMSTSREGVLLRDISKGAETFPISVVNEIDEENKEIPEDFTYITYLNCSIQPPSDPFTIGVNNCRDIILYDAQDPKCVCIHKNEGKSPYINQVLVCRKPMVYECGNVCPFGIGCKNKVVQNGLKIRLEVFKTENCGWGLRTLEPIRAGTFICEFSGLVKEEKEEKGNEEDDEYLFDTSRIYNRVKWNYEPELIGDDVWEQVSDVFKLPWKILISAKKHGNIGRFMNHSCSPNVMWQPIQWEQNGEPFLRIGFFAMKHIPPLTELRYDYGVSSVVEEDGEDDKLLKGKFVCLCGSVNCRGSFG